MADPWSNLLVRTTSSSDNDDNELISELHDVSRDVESDSIDCRNDDVSVSDRRETEMEEDAECVLSKILHWLKLTLTKIISKQLFHIIYISNFYIISHIT